VSARPTACALLLANLGARVLAETLHTDRCRRRRPARPLSKSMMMSRRMPPVIEEETRGAFARSVPF